MLLHFGITTWIHVTPAGVQQAGHVRTLPEGTPAWRVPMPPAERRRLNPLSSLALQAAERLVNSGAGISKQNDASAFTRFPLVYANAQGDGDVLLKLLDSLAAREPVSPTQFHNSVHNAPSGYWCIGNKVQAPSTAIAAGDASLATALVEAGLQTQASNAPVMLLVCDRPHSGPLKSVTLQAEEATTAALLVPVDHPAAIWRCSLIRTPQGEQAAAAAEIVQCFVSNALQTSLWLAPFGAALQVQRVSTTAD